MKWVKHPVVEQNLRLLGIKFDIETNIPFSKIDLEEGKRHQVRMKVNEDVMLRYALKMQEDTAWNMAVLQKEKHSYWPWSGNQRLGAFGFGDIGTHIDAYVVQIHDPVMMDLLPRVVNTWEAVEGMSKEEAAINARYMHEIHRMPVAEAARIFGIKVDLVYRNLQVEECKKKLESSSVTTAGLSNSVLLALGRIENLNAMKRAANVLIKYKVKGDEALQVVSDVRQGNTEAQQIVTLEKWESALETRKAPKKKAEVKLPHKELNRDRLMRLVTSFARFCEQNKTVTQMQLTDPAHLQTVRSQWNVIVPVMSNILKGDR
ncbi:hypothetical protein C4577_04940 [Candidatus Parcubacteria bacterium]|nr:MAG: hypothetical protein C4577_04940 [Candidatus Parcubacteria bacterium]